LRVPTSVQHAHLSPGYFLDRYELLFPFAQGGMATVWLARIEGKHGFEKTVAVKTLHPQFAQDPAFRTMLLDEARICARIRHPNVAEIDDLGEVEGVLYIVLEWIDGDAWAKLYEAVLKAGQPFPHDLALRIAADACAGLHAAHGLRDETGLLLNVVHRDVSPQNILVSTAGVTKVIDFGIANARDRLAERTKTGMLKGKVEFAAPEQIRMKDVDWRADVWAMGVCLYQMLSGNLPFEASGDLETLRRITSGKPPERLPPTVPQSMAALVMRALAFKPDERFQTALDMQRAIEAAMTAPFSTADVAMFVSTYLADRVEARRKEVGHALTLARRRSRPDLGEGPRPRLSSNPPASEVRSSSPSFHDIPPPSRPPRSPSFHDIPPPSRPPRSPSFHDIPPPSRPPRSPSFHETGPSSHPPAPLSAAQHYEQMEEAHARLPEVMEPATLPDQGPGALSVAPPGLRGSHVGAMAISGMVAAAIWGLVAFIASLHGGFATAFARPGAAPPAAAGNTASGNASAAPTTATAATTPAPASSRAPVASVAAPTVLASAPPPVATATPAASDAFIDIDALPSQPTYAAPLKPLNPVPAPATGDTKPEPRAGEVKPKPKTAPKPVDDGF
jgi:eukaryotic-like serine/threonine-protein kinase